MRDHWYLLLIGVPIWAVILWAGYKQIRHPEHKTGCPDCGHADGLDASGGHCGNADSFAGWGSDHCDCNSEYHWQYQSGAIAREQDPPQEERRDDRRSIKLLGGQHRAA